MRQGVVMKWFKHDTDANMDAKLQEVMLDYGLEGYGLYWYCIELIAQNVNGDNLTFELEHDCRIIARNTGSTPQKVEQMMKSFIKLGLLDEDSGHVFCLKLASRCDDFTAKAVRRKGVKVVTNQSVGVSPSLSDKVPLEEEEEEEVRKRSKKKEDITTSTKKHSFSEVDFECAEWFYNLVIMTAPKTKKPNLEKWASVIRLMREVDNITHDEISNVFMWANKDTFWASNILSPDKLRKQFPQLQAKMTGANNEATTNSGRKLSAYERIKQRNDAKYRSEPRECGMGVGADGGHMGRAVDEREGGATIDHVDNGTFIDYDQSS